MQLEIKLDERVSEYLKSEYANFVYLSMKRDLHQLVIFNAKKYKVRESAILNCPLIRWKRTPPQTIDLVNYVESCLEVVKENGNYVIKVNDSKRVKGSLTKVRTLVRLLEFGTSGVPALPVLRPIFSLYRKKYKRLFVEFMKERFVR